MQRKILLSLLLLLVCVATGGLFASRYVTHTTAKLQDLIQLHQIENLRRSLVINVQSVQSDLYTLHTPLARKLDSIVANAMHLDDAASACTECHHSEALNQRLHELSDLIDKYQEALSYYITTRANRERVERNQLAATAIGHDLLRRAEEMSHAATRHLEDLTLAATTRIRQVRVILLLTVGLSLLVGSIVAFRLTRSVTGPIHQLLEATRRIAGGQLDHTIVCTDNTEFAELADNFNHMSAALRDSYQDLQATNAALGREIAERRKAEAQLRLDEFRLSSMLELHQMAEATPQEVAEFVLDRATQLTRSEIGFVGFVTEDGERFVQQAVSPSVMAQCASLDRSDHFIIADAGLWAEAIRQKRAVVVNDFQDAELPKKGYPSGHVGITRLLSIPVLEKDVVVGAAVVANKAEEYGETDIQQLTLLMHGMWQHVQRRRMDEELVRAQKLESVGLLAGGIAHDFNNLLTGILGNVSLAGRHLELDSAAHSKLREVEKACSRAQRLTQQLLTFARGGAPVREVANLAQIVRDAATFATSGATVQCSFHIPDDLWLSSVDAGQISQVISNLVINAEQAMPGGGTIRVECENVTIGPGDATGLAPCQYVRVSIADQGCGISRENLGKVFDPYFTTKADGSGLGLTTSYSIMRQHGGHIAVESQPDAGSTFRLYLPRAGCLEAVAEQTIAGDEQVPPQALPARSRGRILVMDDEEAIRDVALDILELEGFDAIAVADGHLAMDRYRLASDSGAPFDLVILDLTIPGGMGGLEVMRRLRQLDPEVRAIVVSGYSDDPVMADYEHHGFRGRIAKPFKMDSFLRGVRQVLEGTGVHGV